MVLNLKHNPSAKGQDHYKKFCSTYVQLSQLRSLNRLYLLQSITIEDLQFCLDNQLLTEIEKLCKLEQEILAI